MYFKVLDEHKGLDSGGILSYYKKAQDGAVVARRAHNPKGVGSNPAPATS